MNNAIKPMEMDIEKMERALASETFTMPKGLNREEMRQFIIECAKK